MCSAFLGLPLNLSLVLPRHQVAAAAGRGKHKSRIGTPKTSTAKPYRVCTGYCLCFYQFCSTAMASHMPEILQLYGATTAMSLAAGMLLGPSQVTARILQLTLLHSVKPMQMAFLASLIIPLGAVLLLLFGPATAVAVGPVTRFWERCYDDCKRNSAISALWQRGIRATAGLAVSASGCDAGLLPFSLQPLRSTGKGFSLRLLALLFERSSNLLWLLRLQNAKLSAGNTQIVL